MCYKRDSRLSNQPLRTTAAPTILQVALETRVPEFEKYASIIPLLRTPKILRQVEIIMHTRNNSDLHHIHCKRKFTGSMG